jgi:hypothetical protein
MIVPAMIFNGAALKNPAIQGTRNPNRVALDDIGKSRRTGRLPI